MRPLRFALFAAVAALLVAAYLAWDAGAGHSDRGETPVIRETPPPGAPGNPMRMETPAAPDRPPPTGQEGTFAGEVVTSDGAAAVGATVTLVSAGGAVRSAISGENGAFRFEHLAAGAWEARATKDGLSSEAVPVAVAEAGERTRVRLVLEPGATLVGTVRDAVDGLSVASCAVASPAGSAACDRGGRFTLGPLAPGEVKLRISSPGYAPREVSARLAKRDKAFVDVLLQKGAVVRGIVRGPEKQPFARARLATRHYALGARDVAESEAESGPDGAFVLDGVAPGRVAIVASAAGFAEASTELSLTAGAAKDGVELVLSTGGAVEGTVESAAGAPVAGALVEALRNDGGRAGSDTSAANGTFRIDGLSPGKYTLLASLGTSRGMAAGVEVKDRDEASVRLALGDDAISGFVRDGAGKPIAEAMVTAYSSHALAAGGVIAITGENGQFRIEGLVGAPYRVEAKAPGLGTAEVRGVAAGAEVELVLARTGRLAIHVETPRGAPADDVTLAIVPDGPVDGALAERHVKAQVLSPDGLVVRELPAGRYVVRALSAASGRAEAGAEVREGQTTELSLALPAGASVSGQVTTPAGPGLDCRVIAAPLADTFPGDGSMGMRETLADAAGAFQLANVTPGPVLLRATCPDATGGFQRLDLSPGAHQDVQLRTVHTNRREAGEFGGIGASLGRGPEGSVVISAVAEGGPGFLAGLVAGDVLVAVDGWAAQGADLNAVIQRIRGPEGTPVQLDVRRADGRAFRTVAERARIVVP